MTLRSFIDAAGPPDRSLAVVDDGETTEPLGELLADAFADQQLTVESRSDADVPAGSVALLEDGRIVETSSLSDVYDALLAINSDLFVTGARGLEDVSLPAVLAGLDESRFTLRGYPLAHKEKLLLIVVSRYIERLAWDAGTGTLRSGVQQLSRIDDEIGTREVYEQLAASDVSVHVYGAPDERPTDLSVTVHAEDRAQHRDSWFVVFRPDGDGESETGTAAASTGAAALVAVETDDRVWDGFWTYDAETVGAIDEYIVQSL